MKLAYGQHFNLSLPSFILIPVAVLGAIVGSFLNVVIYRLPLGLSILSPKWSFCPHCREPIRPTDNVPIVGWLFLKGRCRFCAAPIGIVYPVIECLATLLFISVWDILFTANLIPSVNSVAIDWPVAIAYLALFAGLLASAAMDIESYTIDIRISVVVMILAVLAHAIRGIPAIAVTPPFDHSLGLLPPGWCLVFAAAGLTWLMGWAIGSLWMARQGPAQTESLPNSTAQPAPSEGTPGGAPTASPVKFQPMPIVVFALLIVALLVWQRYAPAVPAKLSISPGVIRSLLASAVCMFILILASWVHRPADTEIAHEIEHTRHEARGVAIREIIAFAPAILVGVGVFWWLRTGDRLSLKSDWIDMQRISADAWPWVRFGCGALQAVGGMVAGSIIGWTVRILGTLAFGKEAFGTGDIYLMAAIGAAAGVGNLFFGFFLAALLALVGVTATAFRKSSRTIPFGPWLALGSFVALPLEGFLLDFFRPATALILNVLSGKPALN